MPVASRNPRWIWTGRAIAVVVLVGLAGYLVRVGLDTANKLAGSISVVIALAALVAPYLLPAPSSGSSPTPDPDRVEETGSATATAGGKANTGVQIIGATGPSHLCRSGDARADGPGSSANTGIQRR